MHVNKKQAMFLASNYFCGRKLEQSSNAKFCPANSFIAGRVSLLKTQSSEQIVETALMLYLTKAIIPITNPLSEGILVESYQSELLMETHH